ncbi:hypothetical protein VTN00DRAFT_1058 [Thermoascus crustaceus]|uniref:uncharacterized protein n=1 Tax=Thermoascus crustaceus TaxID=5088 RepID=UPI003742E60B
MTAPPVLVLGDVPDTSNCTPEKERSCGTDNARYICYDDGHYTCVTQCPEDTTCKEGDNNTIHCDELKTTN